MSSYISTDQSFFFVPGFVLFVCLSGNLTIFTSGHMEILIIKTPAQLIVGLTPLFVIQLRATTMEGTYSYLSSTVPWRRWYRQWMARDVGS